MCARTLCGRISGSAKANPRLVISLLLFLIPCIANAQWAQTNGPYGGGITALTAAPNSSGGTNLYAGTNVGLFNSSNAGVKWTNAGGELSNIRIVALSWAPKSGGGSIIYAGTGIGLFQSTDDGMTWASLPGTTSQYIFSILNSPDGTGGTVLIAGVSNGCIRSIDGGTHWMAADSGFSNGSATVLALAAIPDGAGGASIVAGCDYSGTLYRSTDYGQSWALDSVGVHNDQVTSFVVDGTTAYAGAFGKGILRMRKNDPGWTQVNVGLPLTQGAYQVYALAAASNESGGMNLFAGSRNGVYISTDQGDHWASLNNGFTGEWATALAASGPWLFAGSFQSGMYRFFSTGSSWSECSNGISANVIQALLTRRNSRGENEVLVGTMGNGVFRSTDNGDTWLPISTGLTGIVYRNIMALIEASDGKGGTNLFAATPREVVESTDEGSTWSVLGGIWSGGYITSLGSVVLTGGGPMSTDFGTSWGGVSYGGVCTMVPNGSNAVELFVFSNGEAIASVDTGKTWMHDLNSSWGGLNHGNGAWWNITTCMPAGNDLYVGTEGGVFMSPDNGASWSVINSGMTDSVVHTFAFGANFFAGCNAGGVYVLTNFGTTWKKASDGLPPLDILSLAPSGTYLLAGTSGNGVWRRTLTEIVTDVDRPPSGQTAASFTLDQNYPNPFNPTTTIEYSVGGVRGQGSGVSNVQLTVYDVLGREVAELVNERKAPGTYSVTFDGSALASGVYFYRLTAGAILQSRKMVLMK